MFQVQVTRYNYSLVHRSTTINSFATDICTSKLQVTGLTQFSPGSVTRYTIPVLADILGQKGCYKSMDYLLNSSNCLITQQTGHSLMSWGESPQKTGKEFCMGIIPLTYKTRINSVTLWGINPQPNFWCNVTEDRDGILWKFPGVMIMHMDDLHHSRFFVHVCWMQLQINYKGLLGRRLFSWTGNGQIWQEKYANLKVQTLLDWFNLASRKIYILDQCKWGNPPVNRSGLPTTA